MKKVFFLSVLALACVFAGCKKEAKGSGDENPVAVEGIKINPEVVYMSPYDTVRLSAVLTPAGAKGTIAWSSSNDSIVESLGGGIITSDSIGEAVIYAQVGNVKAECHVVVAEYFDLWSFYDWTYLSGEQGPDTTVLYKDEKVDGYLYNTELIIYDYNTENGPDGGYAIWVPIQLFMSEGTVYVYNATYELGDSLYTEFAVEDGQGVIHYHLKAGALVDTAAYVNNMLSLLFANEADWDAYEAAFAENGARMIATQFEGDQISYSKLYDGIATAGDISKQMKTHHFTVDWLLFNDENHYYGLEVLDWDAEELEEIFSGNVGNIHKEYTNASSVAPRAKKMNSDNAHKFVKAGTRVMSKRVK